MGKRVKLHVWGGMAITNDGQKRVIVATTTKQRACELLKVSRYYFNYYFAETGNAIELGIALARPEVIFAKHDRLGKDYREVTSDR